MQVYKQNKYYIYDFLNMSIGVSKMFMFDQMESFWDVQKVEYYNVFILGHTVIFQDKSKRKTAVSRTRLLTTLHFIDDCQIVRRQELYVDNNSNSVKKARLFLVFNLQPDVLKSYVSAKYFYID